MKKNILAILTVLFCTTLLTSCTPPGVRKRAFGYFRLGNVENFPLGSVINLPDEGLLIRHDEAGISAMSTLCTFDLSTLTFNGKIFSSTNSASTYDPQGHVLTGPAKANLPFYEVVLDASLYEGPKDTLYAKVGVEVTEASRLTLPK